MKLLRTFYLLAAALLLPLSSCTKGEVLSKEGESDGEISIHLKLSHSPTTKAVADRIADQTPLNFESGHIVFCNHDRLIFKHIGIGNTNHVATNSLIILSASFT